MTNIVRSVVPGAVMKSFRNYKLQGKKMTLKRFQILLINLCDSARFYAVLNEPKWRQEENEFILGKRYDELIHEIVRAINSREFVKNGSAKEGVLEDSRLCIKWIGKFLKNLRFWKALVEVFSLF